MSEAKIDLKKLKVKFGNDDLEWRIDRAGLKNGTPWAKAVAYVTNRAVEDRLDDVCGEENWKNEFREWHNNSQLCGISIKIGNEWVTKWDGADNTEYESTKGGLSDAMKRAAVHWGIGRHLYKLKETFVKCSKERVNGYKYGSATDKYTEKKFTFYWKRPDINDLTPPPPPPPKPKPTPDDEPLDQERIDTLIMELNPLSKDKQAAFYVWLKKKTGATLLGNIKQCEYAMVFAGLRASKAANGDKK